MKDRQYFDADGKPTTLYRLVRKEPDWASSRIRDGEKAEAELERVKADLKRTQECLLYERNRLEDANDKLTAMESQEPCFYSRDGLTGAVSAHTLEAGTPEAKAMYSIPLYAKPVPAVKPSRITEQDFIEILASYSAYAGADAEMFISSWLSTHEGRALLNKLNADREKVPTFDLTCNNFLSMLSGAIPVPDNITNEDEFHDWCKSLPDEQVPAVAVPENLRQWYIDLTNSDQVHDDGEISGYICSTKMIDRLERIIAPSDSQQSAHFNQQELNIIRQWHNCVEDCNPKYLQADGFDDNSVYQKVLAMLDRCPSHESEQGGAV